ncbi:MurR/RpiR family transcriptional regulator [Aurantimonas sp. E1-2-R+4]|uniref:MurR/RpiR family transcriptional regulator n=1 Tax=Aurantimonas sp. E1-2-R+4 TaxID=3113714 RepID=UPI002F93D59A
MKPFVESIHRSYESLSSRERQVADLVLESPGEVSMYPASELAKLAGVSNSTVTRFVQRIGFDNYDDMRVAAREARNWGSPLFLASGRSPESGDAPADPIARFAEQEMATVRLALEGLDPARLDEIAAALWQARNLGFMGFRNSHYFAGYARWQFIQFRERTRLIPGAGETVAERIADLGPDDVVLVVAIRRIVGKLKRYLEALSGRGVKVLLITDPSARVTPAYARWTIVCPVESSYPLDCYSGVLAVIRLLALETFKKSGKPGRDYLEKIEAQHEILGEFE